MFTQQGSCKKTDISKCASFSKLQLLAAGVAAVAVYAAPASTAALPSSPSWAPCTTRRDIRRYGFEVTSARDQCAGLLPPEIVEVEDGDDGWLVAVHVDRAPTVMMGRPAAGRGNLRGVAGKRHATHRELPHRYFVATMEATLHAISEVQPGAIVDVAVFSEGRWGEMVDEQGVPIDWDIATEICEGLGLACTQTLVLLNRDTPDIVPQALECIRAADVFVSSEDEFSQAAASLSCSVKVLTDRWEMDADEEMIALNVAAAVAGLETEARSGLKRIMGEWRADA